MKNEKREKLFEDVLGYLRDIAKRRNGMWKPAQCDDEKMYEYFLYELEDYFFNRSNEAVITPWLIDELNEYYDWVDGDSALYIIGGVFVYQINEDERDCYAVPIKALVDNDMIFDRWLFSKGQYYRDDEKRVYPQHPMVREE